jgi:Zn-finger nucleic acid-binding protein
VIDRLMDGIFGEDEVPAEEETQRRKKKSNWFWDLFD